MKRSRLFISVILVASFSWGMASHSFAQFIYTDIDDPLGVKGSEALGISGNNIVGFYTAAGGIKNGFLSRGNA
jgi:hypothetical protein